MAAKGGFLAEVYKSTDAGSTWTQQFIFTAVSLPQTLNPIDITTHKHVDAAGVARTVFINGKTNGTVTGSGIALNDGDNTTGPRYLHNTYDSDAGIYLRIVFPNHGRYTGQFLSEMTINASMEGAVEFSVTLYPTEDANGDAPIWEDQTAAGAYV